MLETLGAQAPDAILSLMEAFREDARAEKIDLGVGVYKDERGVTPVMRAVREAERRVWEGETTKTYTALAGDRAFLDAVVALVLGPAVARACVAAVATPGGTGAVRQGVELLRMTGVERVWVPEPTWPNHLSILRHVGLEARPYRYLDAQTLRVDAEGMLADLSGTGPRDAVLLHGCCHNPTGADPEPATWAAIADLLREKGALPFVDLAYLGFGLGLDLDAAATRLVAGGGECLVAVSCSKNFGIYRERTGLLMAVCADEGVAGVAQGNLAHLNRQNYSFPPDHGARVVSTILGDEALRADWMAELEDTRGRMMALREALVAELRRATNSARFDALLHHRGMFSRLGLAPAQVEALRREHGVYMVGDSRINVAGLREDTIPVLATAVAGVL